MKRYLIPGFLLIVINSSAQLIYPSTVNVSGQAVKSGNYQFELSLGESADLPSTNISNAWTQSFLNGSLRSDRKTSTSCRIQYTVIRCSG